MHILNIYHVTLKLGSSCGYTKFLHYLNAKYKNKIFIKHNVRITEVIICIIYARELHIYILKARIKR